MAFQLAVRFDGLMIESDADASAAARQVIEAMAEAHRNEDLDAYLAAFDPDAVWVTSRGVCHRGRVALDDYLREVIPGGLGTGSVTYRVESVHRIGADTTATVVEQTYLDADGQPRDATARHTHTYILALRDGSWRIVAGQNTVRS